jgi:hypothetical protein
MWQLQVQLNTPRNDVDTFYGLYNFAIFRSTTVSTSATMSNLSNVWATGSSMTITVTTSMASVSGTTAYPAFTTSNGTSGSGGFTVHATMRANVTYSSGGNVSIQTTLIP